MLLRLLNPQGLAGLAVSIVLAVLLAVQKAETRHWKKQSGQFEQLHAAQQSALAQTIAGYRAAADAARAADRANAERVAADQRAINERTLNEYEARLVDARARADRLRGEAAGAAANPGDGRSTAVPTLPAPTRAIAEAAGTDGLSYADALIATEQAIQLDELVKWVRRQAAVPVTGEPTDRLTSGLPARAGSTAGEDRR